MNYRMMTVAALLVALPACAQKKNYNLYVLENLPKDCVM